MQQANEKRYWNYWYVFVVIILLAEIVLFNFLTNRYQ